MKTEIDPTDIRKGDLIRFEWDDESASEWRESVRRPIRPGTYYLLDRPKPAVELPTEPTLGWVTTDFATSIAFVGRWGDTADAAAGRYGHGYRRIGGRYGSGKSITAFTPATAVPTDALDELRKISWNPNGNIARFLAAVAAANRSSK